LYFLVLKYKYTAIREAITIINPALGKPVERPTFLIGDVQVKEGWYKKSLEISNTYKIYCK